MGTGAIVAGAAIKGIGAIRGRKASKKAAREQEAIARENAALERKEVQEALRRTGETFHRLEQTTTARAAASGLGGTTPQRYIDVMKQTHASELAWMEKSGMSRAAIMEREGRAAASITRAQGTANMWSGLGSAVGSLASIWR